MMINFKLFSLKSFALLLMNSFIKCNLAVTSKDMIRCDLDIDKTKVKQKVYDYKDILDILCSCKIDVKMEATIEAVLSEMEYCLFALK